MMSVLVCFAHLLKGMNMLVLSRHVSERILIGDDVVITVVRIGPNSVRIGVEAPKTMNIVRAELLDDGSESED